MTPHACTRRRLAFGRGPSSVLASAAGMALVRPPPTRTWPRSPTCTRAIYCKLKLVFPSSGRRRRSPGRGELDERRAAAAQRLLVLQALTGGSTRLLGPPPSTVRVGEEGDRPAIR
jgi:hypothetical protein